MAINFLWNILNGGDYLAVRPRPALVVDEKEQVGWDATATSYVLGSGFAEAPPGLIGSPPATSDARLLVRPTDATLVVGKVAEEFAHEDSSWAADMLSKGTCVVLYLPTRPDGDFDPIWFNEAVNAGRVFWGSVPVA